VVFERAFFGVRGRDEGQLTDAAPRQSLVQDIQHQAALLAAKVEKATFDDKGRS